jgi:hypothetical protein
MLTEIAIKNAKPRESPIASTTKGECTLKYDQMAAKYFACVIVLRAEKELSVWECIPKLA